MVSKISRTEVMVTPWDDGAPRSSAR
jgi:hypothetical protein